ncbi:unnamed protein product [Caenorhabditis bovis]|uniref:EF-hand domain-containing protein n=1 Tax=Caenorhabditis bovis TaxID=2654633 RepID=A0A8S1F3D9_9PELO|nr:unnamed protein product [Caenorhabditis bovis]
MATLTERPRPDPCAQSQYRLDYDLFAQVFPRLLPWQVSDIFVVRVFRLLDILDSGLLTFRDLAVTLSILLRGEATEKLALFYKCHLPPAFNFSDLDELDACRLNSETRDDETEIATEATTLLESPKRARSQTSASINIPHGRVSSDPAIDASLRTRCSTSSAVLVSSPCEDRTSDAESLIDMITAKSIKSIHSENEQDRVHMAEVASEDSYSVVDESIEKLKQLRAKTMSSEASSTRLELKILPDMTQIQFIQLWKTFYDMLGGNETDECVFHSLAVTGTLLLQLGETHRELQSKMEAQIADALKTIDDDDDEANETLKIDMEFEEDRKIDPIEEQRKRIGDMRTCIADGEWRVNLEQIMATVIAEGPLCDFFEKKYSLEALIERYCRTRFSKCST